MLGDGTEAVEVKGKEQVRPHDTRHLLQFQKDYPSVSQLILICCESETRLTNDGVFILPWQDFIDRLWPGKIPVD